VAVTKGCYLSKAQVTPLVPGVDLGWLKHCCVPWLTDALINDGCNGRQTDWSDWSAATLSPSWKKRRFIAYATKVRVQSVITVLASNLGRRPLYSNSGESW
jgi:hypothetical protein